MFLIEDNEREHKSINYEASSGDGRPMPSNQTNYA